MKRTLFDAEHLMLRDAFRAFLAREVAPHYAAWEAAGCVPRELWRAAGRAGFLGPSVPEQHGGAGLSDYRYNAVIVEELARGRFMGIGMPVHNDIVIPYFLRYGTPTQQARWLPGLTSGALVGAIAMTEPGAGSDLVGIQTGLLHDLVRANASSGALEHLHDRREHGQVSAGPGLVHAPIHSEATDRAGDRGRC